MEDHENILIKDSIQGNVIAILSISKEQGHILALSANGDYLAATNNNPGTVHVFQNSYDINEG